jgi:hypothetical protein
VVARRVGRAAVAGSSPPGRARTASATACAPSSDTAPAASAARSTGSVASSRALSRSTSIRRSSSASESDHRFASASPPTPVSITDRAARAGCARVVPVGASMRPT